MNLARLPEAERTQLKTPQGKVLIVDDEPSFRRVLRATLAALGFEVLEASTGEQALALLGAERCDVVLLDIDMPGMGGIEVCRELRRKDPRVQIMMLTVRDGEEDKVKAFDAGADDYVAKPFSLPELLARLRAAVRRSGTMFAKT
jgi:two-component system KDP operon response regulator KdpE